MGVSSGNDGPFIFLGLSWAYNWSLPRKAESLKANLLQSQKWKTERSSCSVLFLFNFSLKAGRAFNRQPPSPGHCAFALPPPGSSHHNGVRRRRGGVLLAFLPHAHHGSKP